MIAASGMEAIMPTDANGIEPAEGKNESACMLGGCVHGLKSSSGETVTGGLILPSSINESPQMRPFRFSRFDFRGLSGPRSGSIFK